jgi:hypothetical protein
MSQMLGSVLWRVINAVRLSTIGFGGWFSSNTDSIIGDCENGNVDCFG